MWSKFPILTQDFAILAWLSSEAKVSARSSTQEFLRKWVEVIRNGSEELQFNQNIVIA
jgi:hypothetical protein